MAELGAMRGERLMATTGEVVVALPTPNPRLELLCPFQPHDDLDSELTWCRARFGRGNFVRELTAPANTSTLGQTALSSSSQSTARTGMVAESVGANASIGPAI